MALKNEELNRLHDDELAEAGAAAIDRERLEDDDRQRLAAIDEVGAVVRNTLMAADTVLTIPHQEHLC